MTGEISMDISRSYIYKHTQLMGWPFIVLIVAGAIASIVIGLDHGGVIALIVGFILMVVLILFGALTVTVDDQGVRVDLGPGLIHAASPMSRSNRAGWFETNGITVGDFG